MTAMDVTVEELELQDQVTRALESQGVLGKIKAQLRAAVFQAIHNNNNKFTTNGALGVRASQTSVLPATAMLQSLGADASVALELVRNFLECLELDHTLTVFLAEAGLADTAKKSAVSEWREPARLCERVRVPVADESTPVLVKMVRARDGVRDGAESHAAEPTPAPVAEALIALRDRVEQEEKEREMELKRQALMRLQELLPPPANATAAANSTVDALPPENHKDADDEEEQEFDASMAEEVASVNHSQSEELGTKPLTSLEATTARPGRFGIQPNTEGDDKESEHERSPSIASPPPVPAKLGPLPSLPGMGAVSAPSQFAHTEKGASDDEEDDEAAARSEADEDEDDLDDDTAAARLRSLEEKLKEMEAEDDTGVLQQLKVTTTTLHEPKEVSSHRQPTMEPTRGNSEGEDNENDDNYGSDFEEDVEEVSDEEADDGVASEMSEDIASMSMLSESDDPVTKAKPTTIPTDKALATDTPVESEDALNSYDYIEAVERH